MPEPEPPPDPQAKSGIQNPLQQPSTTPGFVPAGHAGPSMLHSTPPHVPGAASVVHAVSGMQYQLQHPSRMPAVVPCGQCGPAISHVALPGDGVHVPASERVIVSPSVFVDVPGCEMHAVSDIKVTNRKVRMAECRSNARALATARLLAHRSRISDVVIGFYVSGGGDNHVIERVPEDC